MVVYIEMINFQGTLVAALLVSVMMVMTVGYLVDDIEKGD